jgi:hypothetical protein
MIYLTGYRGHSPADLKRLAEQLDATVADIRFYPQSKIPGFSRNSLEELLGNRYLWVHELGNRNFAGDGKIEIVDLKKGTQKLIKHGAQRYILLCACADADTCHRSVVGDYLKNISREGVREINNEEWGAATITPRHVAISIQQPWAWLIINEYKSIENREWNMLHRGPLWIHASKTFDLDGWQWVKATFPEIPLPSPWTFAQGGLVGQVKALDCVTQSSSPWFFGPYGLVMAEAIPVDFLPLRGQQRFFSFDLDKVISECSQSQPLLLMPMMTT